MQDYDALKAEWYQRLREAGFDDIELPDGRLKTRGSLRDLQRLKNFNPDGIRTVSDYYSRADEFLETYPFDSPRDKTLWAHHCQGLSYDKIADKFGLSYSAVCRTIHRLRKIAALPTPPRKKRP